MAKLNEEQRIEQSARMRRGRRLANQPWHVSELALSPANTKPLPEDALPSMPTRFTPAKQKAYENRLEITTRLRAAGSKNAPAIAIEYCVPVEFIRWLDGRSRA